MIRALTRPQAPLCMPSTTPRIILATEREWYDDHRDLIDRLPKAAHPPLEGKHGKYSYTLAVSIASKTVRIEVNVRHCMFRIHGLRGIRQPSIKWGSTWMNDGSLPSSAMRGRPTQCVGLRRGHRSEVLGLARGTSRSSMPSRAISRLMRNARQKSCCPSMRFRVRKTRRLKVPSWKSSTQCEKWWSARGLTSAGPNKPHAPSNLQKASP